MTVFPWDELNGTLPVGILYILHNLHYMGVEPKIGVPPNHEFNRGFHYKPSILGYPYFWKHPYGIFTYMNG